MRKFINRVINGYRARRPCTVKGDYSFTWVPVFLFSSSLKHCYVILGDVPKTTRDAILTEYQEVQQPTITITEIYNGAADCHCNRLIWIAYLCNHTSIKPNPSRSAWPSTDTFDESVRSTVAKVGLVNEESTYSSAVQDSSIFLIPRFILYSDPSNNLFSRLTLKKIYSLSYHPW